MGNSVPTIRNANGLLVFAREIDNRNQCQYVKCSPNILEFTDYNYKYKYNLNNTNNSILNNLILNNYIRYFIIFMMFIYIFIWFIIINKIIK